MKETLLCAAINFPKVGAPVHTCNNVEGLVLCGYRHGHILGQVQLLTGKRPFELGEQIQGFLTSKGNFLDRIEAHKLFIENGGKPEYDDELYSEDLY